MPIAAQQKFEIPGRVTFAAGSGSLPKIKITTPWSEAEVYLHGAHITHFKKNNEPPLLFLSQSSKFQKDTPIRGGIPVIFPWFGPREGFPSHGIARTQPWELTATSQSSSGEVTLRLTLPDSPLADEFPKHLLEYIITIGQTLNAELIVTNTSKENFTFENCLHTYFQIGDINTVSVTGLRGVDYLDKTDSFTRKTEQSDHLKITGETDRIYLSTTTPTEIHDPKLKRRIRVETVGSNSTVVWNPWAIKAKQLSDLGDEEYHQMICVESGNVDQNKLALLPGKSASLKIILSTNPLN